MTIELSDDVAVLLHETATLRGVSPSVVADTILRERLASGPSVAELQKRVPPLTAAEWKAHFGRYAVDCGVSLTDEQLSRENIYE